jgi:hypothetical protein
MTIGKTELLSNAVEQPREMTDDYPGTDSPVGCGSNSDYTVTYAIEKTPPPAPPVPMVATPSVISLLPKVAAEHLRAAGLQGVEENCDLSLVKYGQFATLHPTRFPSLWIPVILGRYGLRAAHGGLVRLRANVLERWRMRPELRPRRTLLPRSHGDSQAPGSRLLACRFSEKRATRP